jgi:hypothetical protein
MLLRKHAWTTLIFLLLGPISVAQNAPKVDVSLGYSLVKSVQGIDLTANGATGSMAWNITNWLGAVGDFGVYSASPAGLSLTAETYTAGTRFSYRGWERFTPFAQVLFGGLHASAGLTGPTNDFGGGAGGGVDIGLDSRGRFALRPQLEYFEGRSSGNPPSTVRFSMSIVYRIGRK